jgi:integrase/recombinase XerD
VDGRRRPWKEITMAKIFWRNGIAWARATSGGVEIRESLGTNSPREAKERFQAWLTNLPKGQSKWNKTDTSFRKAVEVFTDKHLPTLKPNSQTRYLVSLIELCKHFEQMSLQAISKADLAQFVADRRKGGVSDGTIRRDLACLSSVFTIAADWELIESNPISAFMKTQKRRKRLNDAEPSKRYLSHEEEFKILTMVRSEYDVAAAKPRPSGRVQTLLAMMSGIALAIDTGLRDEELLNLTWEDVDLDRCQVRVTAARAKNKKERIVPLLPRAMKILRGLPRHKKSNLVIWHRDGIRFYDLCKPLQRLATLVKITDIKWHDLRKTCGCRLLQDHRMPIEQVSQWLGHSSVAQTQKAYAFLRTEDLHHSVGNIGLNLDGKIKLEALQLPWSTST